jgi:RNA polymerase primary sigma factor
MTTVEHSAERALVAGVMAGEAVAVSRFLNIATDSVWASVVYFVGGAKAGEDAFLMVLAALKANRFERLRAWDGRGRLATFLTIVTRRVLIEDFPKTFALDRDRAWARFDRLFEKSIRCQIAQTFPRADSWRRDDLFNDVVARLLEGDSKRLRAYDGQGSFGGFLRTVVGNLLTDMQREEAPRRRLPAAVAEMPLLQQLIFQAAGWDDVPAEPARMAVVVQGKIKPPPTEAEIAQALNDVLDHIVRVRSGREGRQETPLDKPDGGTIDIPAPEPGPLETLLRRDAAALVSAVLDEVAREAEFLPSDQKAYVRLTYFGSEVMAAREIARAMAVPVEDIYLLQQRTVRWLKNIGDRVRKNLERPSDLGRSMATDG